MESDRFARLVEILGDAMERPPPERAAFVETACGPDEALLAEARALLAEAEATSFEAVTERIREGLGRAADHLTREDDALPDRVGPFRILELLGRGGMGVVYRAEQVEPIHRQVALKVVRVGLTGPEARARFEAERQALAVMDHPYVARIYDAGTADGGVPYFAMELVDGEPITRFCDRRELDLDQRIDLFSEVCRGVQHAHIKGVVHRDLKPSNILVSEVDDRPVPRIIDFGIAKVVEASAAAVAGARPPTAVGSIMGTLEYLSPEQAAAGSTPVDTRSDVYALGVILYELMVGALPLDSETLRNAGPLEAQRIILDTEPRTPLERFRTAPDHEEVARVRRTDPRELRRRLGGDLGWIVMRALEKDPDRRYASASDLAADLGRLRRSEPVEARPPSRGYRAARFVRRHRVGVASSVAVLLAILVGAGLAGTGLIRATRAQGRAENEARRAMMLNRFLTDMLASARPEEAQGRVITVQEVVDSTAVRLDRDSAFADDPVVLASVLHALGVTYRSLGHYDRATPLFERALGLRRSALGPADTLTLNTLSMLVTTRAQAGDPMGAIASGFELVEAREQAHGREHPQYVAALSNLANMHADVGDFATAERMLRDGLEIDRRVLGNGHEDLAFTLNNLATVLVDQEKYEEAIPLHEESLALRRRTFGEPGAEVAVALGNYSVALKGAGRHDEAEAAARAGLEMSIEVFGPDHIRTANTRVFLAAVLLDTERASAAVPLLEEALAVYVPIGERYWRTGDARARLGRAHLALGRTREGVRELTEGWEILTETLRPDSPRARGFAAILARHHEASGEPALAAAWRARAGEAR